MTSELNLYPDSDLESDEEDEFEIEYIMPVRRGSEARFYLGFDYHEFDQVFPAEKFSSGLIKAFSTTKTPTISKNF